MNIFSDFNDKLVDRIPLGAIFIITLIIILICLRTGSVFGRKRKKALMVDSDSPINNVVGATLGLLALMLAFTFGLTIERFSERKAMLLEEVNIISTVYLRSDFLSEPYKHQIQELLKRYVSIRSNLSKESVELSRQIIESEKIQDEIWYLTSKYVQGSSNVMLNALFVESLNQMIDQHEKRKVVALAYRVPIGVWTVIIVLFIISMWSMGFQFGYVGHYSYYVSFIVAIAFASVVMLIADIDRPFEGLVTVNQVPFIELNEKLIKD